MIILRDVMTADVTTVTSDATLREVVELLSSEHITGAPVVDGDEVVGVVSTTDLLAFETDTPGVPTENPDAASWGNWPESPGLDEGEDGPAAYFVEFWEDAGADVVERFRHTDGPEWDVLEEHTVEEIMTRSVVSLPADTALQEAAGRMLEMSIHRVLVTEDDRLVGMVSTTDVMRAVARHGLATAGRASGRPAGVEG